MSGSVEVAVEVSVLGIVRMSVVGVSVRVSVSVSVWVFVGASVCGPVTVGGVSAGLCMGVVVIVGVCGRVSVWLCGVLVGCSDVCLP